jgi:hypothetical protein
MTSHPVQGSWGPAFPPMQATVVEPTVSPMAMICEYGGHQASAELIEYVDGVVVTTCTACEQRIVLARVPGGLSILKLKALLGSAMGLDMGESDDLFNVSDLLGLLNEVTAELEAEESALKRARSMVDLAGSILRQKVHVEAE